MDINLPHLPDTNNILVPPRTIFYPHVAEVPYLDPILLPSLEQVEGGLSDQESSVGEETSSSTEEVSPITPPPVLNNQQATIETLPSDVNTFSIPFYGELPIPSAEVVASSIIASSVSATAAVTGSIVLQSVIGQLKKIMTKIFKKVLKKEITDRQKNSD